MSEKVILVGVVHSGQRQKQVEESLDELKRLTETAGGKPIHNLIQKRERVDPAYYIGKGKAEEIHELAESLAASTIIFDDELSPAQQRNLENIIDRKIIDRTRLILDIFAQRARTREGIIQVELAQLDYLLPRLTGKGIHFSQQLGGIGVRGPGESKLEVDRRKIRDNIVRLKKQVELIKKQRSLQRKNRREVPLPTIALVGYTNAGKSSLLNYLTNKKTVYVDDKLFATLDPTTRKIVLEGKTVLLTDTVGFIRKLPHQLVAAFRATLEEITLADLILEIIDVSSPQRKEQEKVVAEVLNEITTKHIPRIVVYNKTDLIKSTELTHIEQQTDGVFISVLTGKGIKQLTHKLVNELEKNMVFKSFLLPYKFNQLLAEIRKTSIILKEDYSSNGILIELKTDAKTVGVIEKILQNK